MLIEFNKIAGFSLVSLNVGQSPGFTMPYPFVILNVAQRKTDHNDTYGREVKDPDNVRVFNTDKRLATQFHGTPVRTRTPTHYLVLIHPWDPSLRACLTLDVKLFVALRSG